MGGLNHQTASGSPAPSKEALSHPHPSRNTPDGTTSRLAAGGHIGRPGRIHRIQRPTAPPPGGTPAIVRIGSGWGGSVLNLKGPKTLYIYYKRNWPFLILPKCLIYMDCAFCPQSSPKPPSGTGEPCPRHGLDRHVWPPGIRPCPGARLEHVPLPPWFPVVAA
jgi:hypothetical protein